MNVSNVLAGHFRLIRKDDKELVVHIFGEVEKKMVKQVHVDYICNFYVTPLTDRWSLEDAKSEHGFYLIVKKGKLADREEGRLTMLKEINVLEVLAEMEDFRKRNQNEKQSPSDWCMRCLEAILARAAGYESRMDWVEDLQSLQDAETE